VVRGAVVVHTDVRVDRIVRWAEVVVEE